MSKKLAKKTSIDKWELPNLVIFYDRLVKMTDGISLFCDVYLPKDENNLSTLLIRTPYNKDYVFYQGYAHPSWYVSK